MSILEKTKNNNRQEGFLLIELVLVIGIIAILAAIVVTAIAPHADTAREVAWKADRNQIQTAVDQFYIASFTNNVPSNQYPIKGRKQTGSFNLWVDSDSDTDLTTPRNPRGGEIGGIPLWRDDGDGTRGNISQEEKLNAELQTLNEIGEGWYVVKVEAEVNDVENDYVVDSRDYFINFQLLIDKLLLHEFPESASKDNNDNATGSYSWYVSGKTGRVNSLLQSLPIVSNTNYVRGVYP